jgi:hypothetical protein
MFYFVHTAVRSISKQLLIWKHNVSIAQSI